MVTDGLDREWRRYRDACDRVDLIRYHPAFDSGADLAERLEVAETLAEFIEEAIDASEQLIAAAEQQKDLEDNWLNELRDSHAELQLYAANTQDLVGETERRLRHPT